MVRLRKMVEGFFEGQEQSREIFGAVQKAIEVIGPSETRIGKSQIGFWRRRTFASTWIPEKYLHRKAAPLVLTLYFRRRVESPRWKQVVEPAPGRFTHHLELYSSAEVDQEVSVWLREAYAEAG
jgi:hypothetical protein